MKYNVNINKLEKVYDELRQINSHAADNLGVVIDRIEDGLGLSPDHSKTLSLYMGLINRV